MHEGVDGAVYLDLEDGPGRRAATSPSSTSSMGTPYDAGVRLTGWSCPRDAPWHVFKVEPRPFLALVAGLASLLPLGVATHLHRAGALKIDHLIETRLPFLLGKR